MSEIPYILQIVGIARFDKERSDEEREQRRPEVEQRKATHIKNHRHAAPGGRTNIENKKIAYKTCL